MVGLVFISYRRDDASAEAALIYSAIKNQLGEDAVFMDTSSVFSGDDWDARIREKINAAELVIAVIGPDWLRISDEWNRRRIDAPDDWVRRELETALENGARIIPVMVDGARMPPKDVLPPSIQALPKQQKIDIRRDYRDHDTLLLLAQLDMPKHAASPASHRDIDPFPKRTPAPPDPLSEARIEQHLAEELVHWQKTTSALPLDGGKERQELKRHYEFDSFADAIMFMAEVAPGCDIAMHHPRWENIWRFLTVHLSTWDHDLHRITDRDVVLAKYLDRAHADFIARRAKSQNQVEQNIRRL